MRLPDHLRRWLPRLGAAFAVLLLAGGALGACFSAPIYEGPASDHFDGERFHNQTSTDHGSILKFLQWQLGGGSTPWDAVEGAEPGPAPPARVGGDRLRVTFVNHATVLVQTAGLNILTDPIWSDRCSPVGWAGPRRVRPPGIRFDDLPPIDVVVISHNHYDHLDVPTLERLIARDKPRIFAGLGNAALLAGQLGFERVTDLDWWDARDLAPGVRLHCVPAQHFSGRGLTDRDRTLWCGFVVEAPGGSIFYAGDTGFGPHFAQVRERLGAPRLALLPIGAYAPRWFMKTAHVDPDEAVRAHRVLGAAWSMAVHFGTFKLSNEGRDEPAERLALAMHAMGLPEETFWVPGFGESREIPPRVPAAQR